MTHQRTVLPDPVRVRAISLAAEALGQMSADELPPALRPVARFAASQRAKRGATALAVALETHQGFRARVLTVADRVFPGLVDALRTGAPPAAADPVDIAVVAYLLRHEGWEDLVVAAHSAADEDADRAGREAVVAERLREQLDAMRADARVSREKHKAELERIKSENSALRQRLNKTRKQLAAIQQQAEAHDRDHSQAAAAASDAEREVRRLRAALRAAEEESDAARRAGRDGRALETARLSLLIDTLAEAATGLRRELALPPTERRPADDVTARQAGTEALAGNSGTHDADDPARLAALLALPKPHLVVDGYNVTKSIWSDLPLEAQRSRLVAGLRALAARTGAETTCVFDGADVTVPPPVAPTAGVRVRFSQPGETADELIRRLQSAEPSGRVVIVVSSDREVADSTRQRGGYAVGAGALANVLE